MPRAVVLSALAFAAGLTTACSSGGAQGDDDGGGPPDAAATADAPIPPPPPDAAPDAGLTIAELCFPGIGDPSQPGPNYDQFHPTVGAHCAGTNHQDITGVQKVVFLGDSITEGTPPSWPWEYYREVLAGQLRQHYGSALEVAECAAWGARADDLLLPPHQQIHECFPGPEPKTTLIVMTVGGNDMNAFLEDAVAGDTPEQTMAKVDAMLGLFEDAIRYLKDPVNFPAGSHVVFANIYEFTDGTGDVQSCPGAVLAGFGNEAPPQMRPAYIRVDEQYMRIAVETGSDMIFLLESFCGHGFHAGEPDNECYRGPDAETWFDLTCIHPNPTGHAALADLFRQTIVE
jgi:lysophospholipase L1-like esterase